METISNRKVAYGIGWTSISTVVNGLTQILRLSILARFLDKSDFGIVAILTFILGLTQVFSDLGFSAAIMSEKKLDRFKFLNLYWIQLMVFIIIMIVMSSFSGFIADYYDNEMLVLLVPLMLSELVFVGIGKLYDTVLQKEMQFKTIAIRNVCASIISLIIAVVLAVLGAGVYSLVLSTIMNAAIVNVWNLIAGQKTYKLQFVRIDIFGTRDLIKVGAYQMGTQILDYVSSKMDILIIGSFLSVAELGIYNLAKELVLKFVLVINSIVNKVMLPVLSFKADNLGELKNIFKSFVKNITIVNAPIVGFGILFSPLIVTLFYGSGYEDSFEIVRILSVWSLLVVIGQPNGLIAISVKRTDYAFAYTITRLVIMSSMLYLFARDSLVDAAYTMLLTYMIMFIVSWALLLYRTIYIGFIEYLTSFVKPCAIVFVDIVLVYLVCHIIDKSFFLNQIIIAILYWMMIVIYIFLFEKELAKTIISIIKK